MLSVILDTLQFRSNNPDHQPVLEGFESGGKIYDPSDLSLYPLDEDISRCGGVVRHGWREVVVVTQQGKRAYSSA
jgi:hypothetical protein